MLGEQAGTRGGGYGFTAATGEAVGYGDTGTAARFFYVSKASRADRNEGLEGMPLKPNRGSGTHGNGQGDTRLANQSERASGITHVELNRVANHHPTVKSTDLMAWLIKLITPPGGTVLDPFMGSGSTGKAAVRLGHSFIGCELDADYYAIATRRIEAERAKVALPLDVEPVRPPCPECGGKGRPGWPESAIDSKCRYCMGTGLSAEPQPQPPTARPSAAQREMFQ
jgi:site-specific DNA-methyltransferase (adenine-specific)